MSARQRLINEIRLKLGEPMIDLNLDPEHYELAVTATLDRYRQRSGNSYEEALIFLDVQINQQIYTLPEEVQEVRSLFRRGIGGTTGGAQVDPFALAYSSNLYMINNPGGMGGGGAGQLATYDFASQFQSLAGRLFGRDLLYIFDPATHKLTIERNFLAEEQILLRVYMKRPDEILINDVYAKPWIRDYAVAYSKMMEGEARSKYSNIVGPQGGTSLNGDAMKQEAQAEMERLELELQNLIDQSEGYGLVIG
jgi:hypothetical protein